MELDPRLAALPRRLAKMALLAESLSFLFYAAVGPTDWATVISRGLAMDAIDIGNPWWIWAPFLLLFVLAAGLLLVSDGLGAAADVGPPPALIPVSPGPAQLPPFPGGNP